MLGRSGCEGGGAIVNVASITMHGGWPDLAAYVSTKGAAAAFTRAPARELGPREIPERRRPAELTGDLSAASGVRLVTLADGVERGVRALEFRTGSAATCRPTATGIRRASPYGTGCTAGPGTCPPA
ncbi:short subunit dehydrogenase [Nonomuraea fuscirosea]|uniref:Short subunit dehydrogenase n=1 Tax=Nonomuraea fuscirosea TaxID=1291556 RepID=A0A2T0NA17_9ACTN|nr:SDR family NAD(P)-dependent oxidoreductase [Nonomuraea fuscirosea]PRX69628.1 short subunit dehydrogenase [Nonomuraea fuscirosea]